jgi:hypothetical protein
MDYLVLQHLRRRNRSRKTLRKGRESLRGHVQDTRVMGEKGMKKGRRIAQLMISALGFLVEFPCQIRRLAEFF